MTIYTDNRGCIKSVDTPIETLNAYPLVEDNPFKDWEKAKICCYRVNVTEEMVTNVIGTREETYTDLEGNEVTRTADVTETVPTGLYIVTMLTPYVDSRLIPLYTTVGTNTEDITALEAQLDEADMTAIEMYEALLAQTEINDAQDLSILEIYETLGGN